MRSSEGGRDLVHKGESECTKAGGGIVQQSLTVLYDKDFMHGIILVDVSVRLQPKSIFSYIYFIYGAFIYKSRCAVHQLEIISCTYWL